MRLAAFAQAITSTSTGIAITSRRACARNSGSSIDTAVTVADPRVDASFPARCEATTLAAASTAAWSMPGFSRATNDNPPARRIVAASGASGVESASGSQMSTPSRASPFVVPANPGAATPMTCTICPPARIDFPITDGSPLRALRQNR